jgi:hypothetical protein
MDKLLKFPEQELSKEIKKITNGFELMFTVIMKGAGY